MILGYVNPDSKAQDKFSTSPKAGWIQVTDDDPLYPKDVELSLLKSLLVLLADSDLPPEALILSLVHDRQPWDGTIDSTKFTVKTIPKKGLVKHGSEEAVMVTDPHTGISAVSNERHLSRRGNTTNAIEILTTKLKNISHVQKETK